MRSSTLTLTLMLRQQNEGPDIAVLCFPIRVREPVETGQTTFENIKCAEQQEMPSMINDMPEPTKNCFPSPRRLYCAKLVNT